jgi:Excalibur calcium-binding domain
MRAATMVAVLTVALSACSVGPTQSTALQSSYAQLTNEQLWSIQGTTSSPAALLYAEAELGSRGQTTYAGRFLGQRTAGTVGRANYSRPSTGQSNRNCSDFPSAGAAQRYFLSQGGPLSDPSDLDRDGDGYACEWGAKLRQVAAAATPRRSVRPQSTGSRCYTGPRGGTYTITSSGGKNYDGC